MSWAMFALQAIQRSDNIQRNLRRPKVKALYALVGQHHRGMGKFVHHQPERTPVVLRREPGNSYDPNAIMVFIGETHVGYIKGTQAAELAPKMDRQEVSGLVPDWSGALLDNAGAYPQIEVEE